MAISIYKLFQQTFRDYKMDYFNNLDEFLNEFEDNTELYFIKEQKILVDSHLSMFSKVVSNLVEDDENKEEIVDLFRNKINTADRIKEFLEQRKQEIEEDLELKMTKRQEVPALEIRQKSNKSLMFEGKNLNIKDRYRILNKVLDFDKKVHPLNIGELQKYQLLAYILGCDKDNARKLMCGSHDAKDNDLTAYFNDLGLNK